MPRMLSPRICDWMTMSCESFGTCSGRKIRPFARLKIAELAPIPNARDRTATAVNPGVLRRVRRAYQSLATCPDKRKFDAIRPICHLAANTAFAGQPPLEEVSAGGTEIVGTGTTHRQNARTVASAGVIRRDAAVLAAVGRILRPRKPSCVRRVPSHKIEVHLKYQFIVVIVPPTDSNSETCFREQLRLHDDTRFATGKIAIFQYSTVALFLFLISGFWRLQVQNPEYYAERAQQNRIRSRPLLAPRGRILDRDGRVIVDNHVSSMLLLTRENLKLEDLEPIADGLDLNLADVQEKVRHKSREPKYEAIRLKDELTPADLDFINSHRDAFPELDVIQSQPRVYPQDGMMAHVIGYTGEISETELDSAGVRQIQTRRHHRQVRHRAAVQRLP